jgi:hypothetical protein
LATLVLSTVGSALGGPVGGAIGALIGQSIDQELLGGSRGPRVGDLSVQTSSYGTQVPRIYGKMRVAGSVIWSTDLVESSATSAVKGQPDTYTYSVSFAVALSSRSITGIGRIWADGKLIRGADGAFKVNTTFRFSDGTEDQPIDALIGSAEGISNTPAYRGLALAVFENLELAEFGNRIPFLTFEVIADETEPAIGTILNDAARGIVSCDVAEQIAGYAAYGRSIRSAIEPLVGCFAIALFDDGSELRSPAASAPLTIAEADFGNGASGEQQPRLERQQLPATELPAALRLSYYDPARDFQAGESRANAVEQTGREEQVDLPAVMSADAGKSLSQKTLARRWAGRDRLKLRLPPRYLALEPGSALTVPVSPANWTVDQCTLDGFVIVTELRPTAKLDVTIAADSGRIAPNIQPAPSDVSLALFDVPLLDQSSAQPTIMLAASSPTAGWKSSSVEVAAASQTLVIRTAVRKTILGHALTVLGPGEPYLIDEIRSVDIELIDAGQWLVSCDDEALVNGTNLAALGSELIQFGEVNPIGPGRFRLKRLMRGRGGTEWATGVHSAGEQFALIEGNALRAVELPDWVTGSQVAAAVIGGAVSREATTIVTGESLRPPTPVRLESCFGAGGDLTLSWIRRSRRGWAWVDEIDAPLGESREAYRVTVAGPLGSIELETGTPEAIIIESALASVGSGEALVEVRQIGDFAASRPARQTIIIA